MSSPENPTSFSPIPSPNQQEQVSPQTNSDPAAKFANGFMSTSLSATSKLFEYAADVMGDGLSKISTLPLFWPLQVVDVGFTYGEYWSNEVKTHGNQGLQSHAVVVGQIFGKVENILNSLKVLKHKKCLLIGLSA